MGKKDKGGRGGRRGGDSEDEDGGPVKPGRTHNKHYEKQAYARQKRKERSMAWNKDDMAILAPQLEQVGLTVKEVQGDGNCLFRSLSDQVHGVEGRHHEFRALACRWMRDHPDDFSPFLLEEEGLATIEEYCDNMEKDAEWGGNLELLALAQALRANITIHQADQRPWSLVQHKNGADVPSLHVSYHNNDHYNSVRAGFDLTTKSALALKLNAKDGCYEPSDGRTTLADILSRSFGGAFCTATATGFGSAGGKGAKAGAGTEAEIADAKEGGKAEDATASGAGTTEEGKAPAEKEEKPASGAPRRNGPCHCGSGKAYRKCCQDSDLALQRKMAAIKLKDEEKKEEDAEAAKKGKKRGGRGGTASGDEDDDDGGKKKAMTQQEAATPILI